MKRAAVALLAVLACTDRGSSTPPPPPPLPRPRVAVLEPEACPEAPRSEACFMSQAEREQHRRRLEDARDEALRRYLDVTRLQLDGLWRGGAYPLALAELARASVIVNKLASARVRGLADMDLLTEEGVWELLSSQPGGGLRSTGMLGGAP